MKIKKFTLIEVLIALAVLSLGVLTGTALLSSATRRCRTAEADWRRQHAMSQAAEYFLLAGTDEEIPERFFPFRDYRVSVRLEDPAGLPPDTPDRKPGWRLATMKLELMNSDGEIVRELSIDRIIGTGEK